MKNTNEEQEVIETLKDAGMSSTEIEDFLKIYNTDNVNKKCEYLFEKRKQTLNKVHKEEEKINCLDYLIYKIKKENGDT